MAASAITDLKQMVISIKDEYSLLVDEKKSNELAFESKLKEKGEYTQMFCFKRG